MCDVFSCVVEASLSWETPVGTTAIKHSTFSLSVYDFFTDGRFTYLHCELSPCRRLASTGHQAIPQCSRFENTVCPPATGTGVQLPVSIQSLKSGHNIVTIGPWEITDKEINIAVPASMSDSFLFTWWSSNTSVMLPNFFSRLLSFFEIALIISEHRCNN